jgi:hypothetical protein
MDTMKNCGDYLYRNNGIYTFDTLCAGIKGTRGLA